MFTEVLKRDMTVAELGQEAAARLFKQRRNK